VKQKNYETFGGSEIFLIPPPDLQIPKTNQNQIMTTTKEIGRYWVDPKAPPFLLIIENQLILIHDKLWW
jgi:hypothetical protein